jgi:hypothetical protein
MQNQNAHTALRFLVFPGLFCQISCSKMKETRAGYTLSDYYTGAPLPGINVQVVRQKPAGVFERNAVEKVSEANLTDSDGKIEIVFEAETEYNYWLTDVYSAQNTYGTFSAQLKRGENNTGSIPVKKYSIGKLTLKNTSKKYDQIFFTADFGNFNGVFKDSVIFFRQVEPDSDPHFTQFFMNSATQKSSDYTDSRFQIAKVDTFGFGFSD